MLSRTLLVLVAFFGLASAFNPTMQFNFPKFGGGNKPPAGQMGTQRVPTPTRGPAAGAQTPGLRGPFGPEDSFELPDGRTYQPGDACTDDIYGAALASPVELDDGKKAIAAAGFLGFAVAVPTILIKVIGGY